MKRLSVGAWVTTLLISLGIWVAVASLCLLVGSTVIGIPPTDLFWSRLKLVLLASLVGASLSAAGVTYQAILRNPLADPYLLGVASGAALGTYVWRFPMSVALLAPLVSAIGLQTASLVGALITVALVFGCSVRRGRLEPVTLLLVGVIVSSLCAALLLLLVTIKPQILAGADGLGTVLIGGLQTNLTIAQEIGAQVICGLCWVGLLLMSSPLSVAMLSDVEAEALGVRVNRLRWMALITASIMVAAAVAVSGPIGFVGLICPHLGRLLVGPDPRRLLPVATALGAALLAAADALGRLFIQQQFLGTQLPAGVITALLGGPFFLLLLLQQRKAEGA